MFIKEIANVLQEHYSKTAEGVKSYEKMLLDNAKDATISAQYKSDSRRRIHRERLAYIDNRAADLEKQITTILDAEKSATKSKVTSVQPTDEQLKALNLLKTMDKVTQLEFDQYATMCKGCYMLEKALSELAAKQGLHYDFQPLEKQLSKVDRVENDLKHCYRYTGEPNNESWKGETVGNGQGIPYLAQQYFIGEFAQLDKYIQDYENGNFVATPRSATNLERLQALKESHPLQASEIDKFISDNAQSLGVSLFESSVQDFINAIETPNVF